VGDGQVAPGRPASSLYQGLLKGELLGFDPVAAGRDFLRAAAERPGNVERASHAFREVPHRRCGEHG